MQNSLKANNEFANNQIFTKGKKTTLILSKVNLKEKPVLKKYLSQFFDSPTKFFVRKYSDKEIIMNKFKSFNEIYEVPIPQKIQRRYKRRKTNAAQTLNFTLVKEQISEFSNNFLRDKKKGFKEILESRKDKEDRRLINDKEIQNIFTAYESVHKINKNRTSNFITKNELVDLAYKASNEDDNPDTGNNIKENENNKMLLLDKQKLKYIEKRLSKSKSSAHIRDKKIIDKNNNNDDIFIPSSSRIKFQDKYNNNLNQLNLFKKEIPIPKIKSQKLNNKIFPRFTSVFDEIITPKSSYNNKNAKNNNNVLDNNSTVTSQFSTLYKTHHKTFRTKLKSTLNNFEEFKEKKKVDNNEQLLEKQAQYILNPNNIIHAKEMKKKLAGQEKALTCNSLYNKKTKNMVNFISKKLKKEKSDIMMGGNDDYRIANDIKYKLSKMMKTAFPEYNYKWINNLRNQESDNNSPKSNKIFNYEIVRNPFNIYNSSRNKIFTKTEDDYIKKHLPKIAYRKLIKDIKNIKGNLNELLIEGQNLLKYEQDLIKQLKGKKVLINCDNAFQEKELNDVLYAYNININNI